MVNQQRNSQVRDRLRRVLILNMQHKNSEENTIDVEYEDVTDELRSTKKQIPSSKGEIH